MTVKPVRILGIDPGTANLGYAILDFHTQKQNSKLKACGIISTNKNDSEAMRLCEIRKDLEKIIIEFKPEILAIEKLFFFKNIKTAIAVAQARGVILELAANKNLLISEFTPLEMKKIITGDGTATKTQVSTIIHQYLNLNTKISPDDAVDAIGLAICFTRNYAIIGVNERSLV